MMSKGSERQPLGDRTLAMAAGKRQSIKREQGSDPWLFLEVIDAPQWVDLPLEARSIGKENIDPWFESVHEHHAVSLAGYNRSMSWVHSEKSLGKTGSRSNNSQSKGGGYTMNGTNQEKSQNMMKVKTSDSGCFSKTKGRGNTMNGASLVRVQNTVKIKAFEHRNFSRIKDSDPQKKAIGSLSSYSYSKAHLPLSKSHCSVDSRCRSSDVNNTLEYEQSRSSEDPSSNCSDMSTVTSSLRTCTLEEKSSVDMQWRNICFLRSKACAVQHGSMNSICTPSGSSSDSGNEPVQDPKKRSSLCSDSSSVSSSSQSRGLEPKSLVNVRRGSIKQLRVGGCGSDGERDLAALVAQHNQKILNLKLQGCKKGLCQL
ncbi:hypothetical protein KP509_01G013000 [Ceratopteris richardii]|uniref:Uncharacterized protein n=1 Tax=Ceratopteris richardii TaxID=49495 RepID=A0A8T2VDU3_CERRI|nr:hypothetical protein KP509_01G013000 [Ceratopteris richardii]